MKTFKYLNNNSMLTMGKKSYWILVLMLTLLFIPFVYAQQESIGVFRKDTCVIIYQVCSNCTYVNFTSIISPTNKLVTGGINGTRNGSYFYVDCINSSLIGTYIVNGEGDIDGKPTVFAYTYRINPSGITETDNPIGIIVPMFSILINLGVLILSFKRVLFKNELVNFVAKRALMVIGIWLLILNSGIMAGIAQYAGLDLTKEMFMFMSIFGYGAYISMIILIFTTLVQYLNQLKMKRKEKRLGYND